MATTQTVTLTEAIDAAHGKVAADLADPMNHPKWATEFFDGPATDNGDGSVLVDVPMMGGPAPHGIDADIDWGIIDLFLAPGDAPFGAPLLMRLVPNGDGVDVLWTLGRPEGIPDLAWEQGLDSMSRELARRVGMSRQGPQQLVAGLVDQGLVELVADPTSGRSKVVYLTERGKESVKIAQHLFRDTGATARRQPW